jgi:hypothetical protein
MSTKIARNVEARIERLLVLARIKKRIRHVVILALHPVSELSPP